MHRLFLSLEMPRIKSKEGLVFEATSDKPTVSFDFRRLKASTDVQGTKLDQIMRKNDDLNSEKPLQERILKLREKLLTDPERPKTQNIAKSFNYLTELVKVMGCNRSQTGVRTQQDQPSFDMGSVGPTELSRITIGKVQTTNIPDRIFINVGAAGDLNESPGVVNIKCELNPVLIGCLNTRLSSWSLNTLKRRNMDAVLNYESLKFIESVY